MIKANLRRQIEMEEDRKAVRTVWGGVSVFLHISTAGTLVPGPTNIRKFSQRPTNSCSHRADESGRINSCWTSGRNNASRFTVGDGKSTFVCRY